MAMIYRTRKGKIIKAMVISKIRYMCMKARVNRAAKVASTTFTNYISNIYESTKKDYKISTHNFFGCENTKVVCVHDEKDGTFVLRINNVDVGNIDLSYLDKIKRFSGLDMFCDFMPVTAYNGHNMHLSSNNILFTPIEKFSFEIDNKKILSVSEAQLENAHKKAIDKAKKSYQEYLDSVKTTK